MTDCCIGLGANLGDPLAALQAATLGIAALPGTRLLAASPVYRSAPVGPAGQPDYLNACVRVDTALTPLALLERLQALETDAGRVRDQRWGPRTLDLDLLLYGKEERSTERLILPHPRIRERNFVLRPLIDMLGADFRLGDRPLADWLLWAPANRLDRTGLQLLPTQEATA
ncbi:MAG: 2-amino-4-hydroxy-6-hydroxymethyldihydropteridine diphosphokinase [Pseudomonadota bacterium]